MRTLFKQKRLLNIFLFLFSFYHLYAENARDLVYMEGGSQTPPFAYMEEGTVKGISIDILRLLWGDMDIPEQPIVFYPWARAYQNLIQKDKHVILGITRTEDRESLFKWVGPYASIRFGIFSLKSQQHNIDRIEDLNSFTIGTVRNDIMETILEERGFEGKMEPERENLLNINKVKAGRIDLIASLEFDFYESVKKAGFDPDDFELVYILKETDAYFGFHKNVSDSLIDEFQTSLDKHKEDVRKIVNFYFRKILY